MRFLINFEFYAPQLVLESYATDIFVNGMVIGLSEVVSTLTVIPIIDHFSRRWTIFGTSLIGVVLCVPLLAFYSC